MILDRIVSAGTPRARKEWLFEAELEIREEIMSLKRDVPHDATNLVRIRRCL